MMRLDKYLSERTGMTRSESRKAITKGRVAVNGAVCRKADTQVAEDAAVAVDGTPLAGTYQKYVYIMLNKPEGVVSASRDKRDTTVVDLVAADFPRRRCFRRGGWTKPAPVLCCLLMTALWPTTCSPRRTMWTRSISSRWTPR